MEQGTSKTHAENMLMSMFKLQQKSYLTDVTIVCKDGLLYGESIQKFLPGRLLITYFATPHPSVSTVQNIKL